MRTQLHIGEVAKLLGITQKTIRHYHKVGLLAEPSRSESGHRLYNAHDLVRLQRIQKLQALGLSLKQVKMVLGEAISEHERTLREVLQALLLEISTEIQTLEGQRERIQTLLAEDTLDIEQPDAASPTLAYVKEHLEKHLSGINEPIVRAALEQEAQFYTQLDSLHWPEGYNDNLKEMVQYFSIHPEMYEQLLELSKLLLALADVPEDSPEVERLIEEVSQSLEVFDFLTTVSNVSVQTSQRLGLESPFMNVLNDLLVDTLSPAQRRFLQEMSSRAEFR